MKRGALGLTVLAILFSCRAQAAPKTAEVNADLCANTGSNAEYTGCWQHLAEQAQHNVDAAFKHALAVAKSSDLQESYGGEPKNWITHPLERAQSAWTNYRNQQCVAEGNIARGGSGTDTLVAKCEFRLNQARAEELDASASVVESLK